MELSWGIDVGEASEPRATGADHKSDVFVSYASPNSSVADAVCAALERAGLTCWIAPRDVRPGAFYGDEIVHAIDSSKAIVLILSHDAASSPHVLREVERAASKRHPVVSLRIDEAPLPAGLQYFLNTSQWLDAIGGDTARALPKLVAAVRVAIEKPPTADDTAAATPRSGRDSWGRSHASGNRSRYWTAFLVASLMAVGVAAYIVHRSWPPERQAIASTAPITAARLPVGEAAIPAIPERSVAVLPFADMSEKRDQEYFSDGLSEELIDMLTKIPDLRVPARTSSFYFKGRPMKIPDIARELRVAHVLEGSVRRSGNHLRITAELIRADNGYHIWSQTYDRTPNDIFKVQDEIARSVVAALKLSLPAAPQPKAISAEDTEAYTLFLQARARLTQMSKQSVEQAAAYLKQALALDPKFAPAWALYAKTRTILYEAGAISLRQAGDEARAAATRAIELDPDLPAAHVSMARVHSFFDWDWAAMNAQIKLARQLDPNDSDALRYAGIYALIKGRPADAIEALGPAVERDPLEGANYEILGLAYLAGGRLQEARRAFDRSASLDPILGGISGIAMALLFEGEKAAALSQFERCPNENDRLAGRALTLYALGQRDAADAALADLEKRFVDDVFRIAMIHAYRGEIDQSFVWIDRAYAAHDRDLSMIKSEPLARNLRGDPRYDAILKKMNLFDE
jgi:TolB-like protein/Flp pilus assembly protein TadD